MTPRETTPRPEHVEAPMNTQESQGVAAISRRDMLRRSAVLGGALAVAAPTVQSFARPAFAQTPIDDSGLSNLFVAFWKAAPGGCIVYGVTLVDGLWEGQSTPEGGQFCATKTADQAAGADIRMEAGLTLPAIAGNTTKTYTVSVTGDWQIAFGYVTNAGSCARGCIENQLQSIVFTTVDGAGAGNAPAPVEQDCAVFHNPVDEDLCLDDDDDNGNDDDDDNENDDEQSVNDRSLDEGGSKDDDEQPDEEADDEEAVDEFVDQSADEVDDDNEDDDEDDDSKG